MLISIQVSPLPGEGASGCCSYVSSWGQTRRPRSPSLTACHGSARCALRLVGVHSIHPSRSFVLLTAPPSRAIIQSGAVFPFQQQRWYNLEERFSLKWLNSENNTINYKLLSQNLLLLLLLANFKHRFLLFLHCDRTCFYSLLNISLVISTSVSFNYVKPPSRTTFLTNPTNTDAWPAPGKQTERFVLLRQWTRKVAGDKRAPWETPGVSIWRKARGDTGWINQQTNGNWRSDGSQSKLPKIKHLSCVLYRSWVSSQNKTFDSSTSLFLVKKTSETNWKQKGLFRCQSFGGDFAAHRFNSDHPVPPE